VPVRYHRFVGKYVRKRNEIDVLGGGYRESSRSSNGKPEEVLTNCCCFGLIHLLLSVECQRQERNWEM